MARPHNKTVHVRRVDECSTLDELFRHCLPAFGGAFLIIMAMVPKVGALIALMPNAVLGGVLLFMFGMVASVGVDIIGRNMTSRRDALILAASLGVGLGIQAAPPGAFDAIAPALRILVTDGIVMGILLAMVLNLVMPKET